MNQHCGRHDKIFSETNPCLGCANEAKGERVSSAEQSLKDEQDKALDNYFGSLTPESGPRFVITEEVSGVRLPEKSEDVVSNLLSNFERTLRNALKR